MFALLFGCSALVAAPAVRADVQDASATSISGASLRSAATDAVAKPFYARNGWHTVWSPSAARALDQVLASRAAHGLDRIAFLNDGGGKPRSGAEQDVARTRAALRYAQALAAGLVDPASLHEIYTLPRPKVDLVSGLSQALAQGNLAAWFASLPPQDDEYAALSAAYRSAAQQARDGSGPQQIAASGLIHAGDTDARVPEIARRLAEAGYLQGNGRGADPRFTQQLADALTQLQRDYGIAADGVVGPETLQVLNVQAGDRARALAVALERRRWLARTPPDTRIDVNIAAARLRYYRNGSLVDRRKVIVGKPGRETPLLMAPIYRLVANPTWTIPKSIENSEMANVDADYLKSRNIVRKGGYLVQQSGPANALGLVKFDMLDDQAIYLHDTNAASLFSRSQRQLSHGCVRVDDALGFAEMIARDEGVADKWQAARAASDQQFVDLPHQLPVRLLYHDVFVDAAGKLVFRTDPYGWNGAIAERLGFGDGSSRRATAGSIDIGP